MFRPITEVVDPGKTWRIGVPLPGVSRSRGPAQRLENGSKNLKQREIAAHPCAALTAGRSRRTTFAGGKGQLAPWSLFVQPKDGIIAETLVACP